MLNSVDAIKKINSFARKKIPFLFIVDFEKENNVVIPLEDLSRCNIQVKTPGFSNIKGQKPELEFFRKTPVTLEEYSILFNKVLAEIKKGNSFLLNLTMPTPVESNLNLSELFLLAEAKYKLYYDNEFALFSPESFISIENGVIRTFPMKGTIRADYPNALQVIMADAKEAAEHATIVDLLRNDISMVAENVKVKRFRYHDLVQTNYGAIYQISSEIEGILKGDYEERLGNIIFSLLPAGSVTGAPKPKTIDIIREVEVCPRGFYTGVFGIWDTQKLDSAVMIRFIKNDNGKLIYHSGGGLTFKSICENEYIELIDKVYVPIC